MDIKQTISDAVGYLKRLITQPTSKLSRVQRTVRFAVDLSRHCAGQLQQNHAPQMAAALTYRTIFSLVPVAVLMLLVFRAFGGFESASVDLQDKVFDYLGLSSIALPTAEQTPPTTQPSPDDKAPDDPADKPGLTAPAPATPPTTQPDSNDQQLRAGIQRIITDLTQKAAQVNVRSIGVVGLLVLIWAALALLITVERSFNQIYRSPAGRSWHLRIPIYWAVITLGPVLLWVSFYVAESLVGRVQGWVVTGGLPGVLSRVLELLSRSTALAATWLLLFLMYVLMPTARVRRRPALVGSLVAAGMWELGKVGFKYYVSRAVSYSVLYGSLGLVPLFLLWLYVTWLIVLFGLEITYTLQAMRGRQFEKQAQPDAQRQVYDARWLIPMVTRIGQAFCQGQSIDAQTLAQELGLPQQGVAQLCTTLRHAGLIHPIQTDGGHEDTQWALAKRPEAITLQTLFELDQAAWPGIGGTDQDQPGWAMLHQLNAQQQASVGQMTLAQLLEAKKP